MKTSYSMKPASRWDAHYGLFWAIGAALVLIAVVTAIAILPGLGTRQPDSSQPSWLPDGWRTGTPEEQGFDSAKLAEGLLSMREEKIPIHSLMIIRNGSVIVDAYFYPYDGKNVHDQASVTKSILTTLIGIAADQGKLSLDQPVLSFFPERTIANPDARKERIKVGHLASMSSGLDCTRASNYAVQTGMMSSLDWVQYALDLRVRWEPGSHFEYCNAGMHLLSGVLTEATGMSALEFAQQNVFEPLGINNVLWPADPQGVNRGWGDIYLHPHDMAKIGYLWLNKGEWQGKQIVSREWVESSVKKQIAADSGEDYGYGWWIGRGEEPEYGADGLGGQRIRVLPRLNVVLVTTGGGFEAYEISPYLEAALADGWKPLPSNPAGVASLEEALATIALSPDIANPVPPLPATAKEVSGKTFVFAPGSVLKTMRLEFDDSDEAHFELAVATDEPTRGGTVGLDGVYRISPVPSGNKLPEGYRGYWADAKTFALDYDRIGNNEAFTIKLYFEGEPVERVVMEIRERSGGLLKGEARVQNP